MHGSMSSQARLLRGLFLLGSGADGPYRAAHWVLVRNPPIHCPFLLFPENKEVPEGSDFLYRFCDYISSRWVCSVIDLFHLLHVSRPCALPFQIPETPTSLQASSDEPDKTLFIANVVKARIRSMYILIRLWI